MFVVEALRQEAKRIGYVLFKIFRNSRWTRHSVKEVSLEWQALYL